MKTAMKFMAVGIWNTALNYIVYCLLLYVGVYYIIASTLAYLAATVNSYFFNKRWTFRNQDSVSILNAVAFFFVNLTSLACTLAVLKLCVSLGINVYFAQIFAIAFSVIINFFGCKFIVFRK